MAYKFRKNCERSDAILQRFLNPTDDPLNVEYIDQMSDTSVVSRNSKDSKVVVSSDYGLYEYQPPSGLNVKLVKNKPTRATRSAQAKKAATSTIYLKSEPLDGDETPDESDCIDVLYDIQSNFDDSNDAEKTIETTRKTSTKTDVHDTTKVNPKAMQFKPVRTNKVRLGFTSTNKTKPSETMTVSKAKANENASKENASINRSPKKKPNTKGEPKQPKKCEICGNTYKYQHALDR